MYHETDKHGFEAEGRAAMSYSTASQSHRHPWWGPDQSAIQHPTGLNFELVSLDQPLTSAAFQLPLKSPVWVLEESKNTNFSGISLNSPL